MLQASPLTSLLLFYLVSSIIFLQKNIKFWWCGHQAGYIYLTWNFWLFAIYNYGCVYLIKFSLKWINYSSLLKANKENTKRVRSGRGEETLTPIEEDKNLWFKVCVYVMWSVYVDENLFAKVWRRRGVIKIVEEITTLFHMIYVIPTTPKHLLKVNIVHITHSTKNTFIFTKSLPPHVSTNYDSIDFVVWHWSIAYILWHWDKQRTKPEKWWKWCRKNEGSINFEEDEEQSLGEEGEQR